MLIDIRILFGAILGIFSLVLISYLVIALRKLIAVLDNINSILNVNKEYITSTSKNLSQITDNIKDVSEVVTETTAEAIIAKENVSEYINIFRDILFILQGIFKK